MLSPNKKLRITTVFVLVFPRQESGEKAFLSSPGPPSAAIDPLGAGVHTFPGRGGAIWKIYKPPIPREEKVPICNEINARPDLGRRFVAGWQSDAMVVRKEGLEGKFF